MSRGSSIRSAAQATFSAPRQIPIRWRLAGGSALLTLVILCGFAGAVGGLTSQRLHEDFDREVSAAADLLQARIKYNALVPGTEPNSYELDGLSPPLAYYDDGTTIVRIVLRDGLQLAGPLKPAGLHVPASVTLWRNKDAKAITSTSLCLFAGCSFE